MPVSRKRKKSQKSAAAAKASRRREQSRTERLANSLPEMVADWEQEKAQRIERARPYAREIVEQLATSPATGTALEDELCARLGPLLTELNDRTPAEVSELLDPANRDRLDQLVRNGYDFIGPEHFAEALADAAREAAAAADAAAGATAVAAVDATADTGAPAGAAAGAAGARAGGAAGAAGPRAGGAAGAAGPRAGGAGGAGGAAGARAGARDGSGAEAAGRVLAAVTAILPAPLRRLTGLESPDPRLDGEVRWTRDRYGTRFAVAAPFAVPEGLVRWYLWDIDACGLMPVPVHAGFYASPEEALAAWQVGVGPVAAGGTAWHSVDDAALLSEVLPELPGLVSLGGESVEQHAEYLRCRRLAEVLRKAAPAAPISRPDHRRALASAWRQRLADATVPEREAAGALLRAWPADVPALIGSCSPHRVAYVAQTVREEYPEDGFAEQVIALLPRWADWLAERNGTPPELAERARPYAEGLIHPDLAPGDLGSHQARVIE